MTRPDRFVRRALTRSVLAGAALLVASVLAPAVRAASENDDIRLTGAFGFTYLPTYVVLERHLIEKHAEALGISPKVKFQYVSGGSTINDSLLSDTADLAPVGVPNLVYLWDKARGARAVKGVVSLLNAPSMLFTVDPKIKSIKDFTSSDRVAMTTVKVSSFAIMLQMAAVQQLGWDQRFKFDDISVAMQAPDSTAAMLNGGSEIKSAAEQLPFNAELLEAPNVRVILNSDDVIGGRATQAVLAATEKFHTERPKSFQAVKAAYIEAIRFINENKGETARIFTKWEPSRRGPEWIQKILEDGKLVTYTPNPDRVGQLADFIHRVGSLKNKPNSWKDFFFDDAAGLGGS